MAVKLQQFKMAAKIGHIVKEIRGHQPFKDHPMADLHCFLAK